MGYISFRKAIKQYGLVGSLFGFLNGRCTALAIVFTVCGITLAFLGKLTADYVALVGAIQALVLAHSFKEDQYQNQKQSQQQQVVNNITIDPNAK